MRIPVVLGGVDPAVVGVPLQAGQQLLLLLPPVLVLGEPAEGLHEHRHLGPGHDVHLTRVQLTMLSSRRLQRFQRLQCLHHK